MSDPRNRHGEGQRLYQYPPPQHWRLLRRPPFLVAALASLLAGISAGLHRAGIILLPENLSATASHAPLMVGGFLGTLIGTERAVAIGKRWAWAAPLLSGAAGLSLLLGADSRVAGIALAAASAALIGVFADTLRRQRTLHTAAMAAGSLAWMGGNLGWLFKRPPQTWISWWAAFLILTIVGERLELTRLRPPQRLRAPSFGVVACLQGTALTVVLWRPEAGLFVSGIAFSSWGCWLFTFDISRRTVRRPGLPRYTAVTLLAGYVWLLIGGVLWCLQATTSERASLLNDASLHAVFLGFVFSMVFAHGPIVLPSVLGREVSFYRVLYVPVALLQLSVALRVLSGVASWGPGRMWGASLNALAIVAFPGAFGVGALFRSQDEGQATGIRRGPLT